MAVTGRRIRLTAVLLGVVLALTGFSSTGGSSSGKSKSSGGGGCSSSKSKSKKKSYSYGSSTGGSGGGSAASATPSPTATRPPAHAEVLTCAGPGVAKATVKVTSDSAAAYTFRVPLVFEGAAGRVDSGSVDLALKAGESRTVDLPMTSADKSAQVQRCVIGTIETRPSPTPTSTSSGSSVDLPDGRKTSKPKSKSTRKTR